MTVRSVRRRLLPLGAVLIAGLLSVTACGGDSGSDDAKDPGTGGTPPPGATAGGATAEGAQKPFDMLPADIRKSKVVKVGSEVAYAPMEFMKDGKATGVDPDIAAALGRVLDVRFEVQNTQFDSLITGLTSKRYDLVMSSMTDTRERQGQGVTFVDYFRSGTSILVKKGNPENIRSLDDLCGKTVALQKATTNEDIAKAQSDKCRADGKGGITIQAYAHDGEALLKVKGGGAVADLNDFPVAAYNAQTSGGGNDFEVAGEQIEAGLYGIGVSSENPQLRDAVKAALEQLIADGEYGRILDTWKVRAGAVTEVTVNGGT